MEKPKLTQLSKGSGCGCKIAPADLHNILKNTDWSNQTYQQLLVGNGHNDDAAVYQLDENNCIISTTDFFTPIVDDPHDFGAIAACNAISDVYAMGGKPIMALGILGWPIELLGAEMASEVISGAKETCALAGIPIAGGHSIDSKEPFFGLAVNGLVSKEELKTNKGAKPGNQLFLTKPIGTGMAAAGLKRGVINEKHLQETLEVMLKLNDVGTRLGKLNSVTAITDITGFGLLGHLIELCEASGVKAKLDFEHVPTLSNQLVDELIRQFVMPDNTMRNFKEYSGKCNKLSAKQLQLLCDPQSNGGLLISVDSEGVNETKEVLDSDGLYSNSIGHIESGEKQEKIIEVI
jgi:selenide,water dikinase